MKSQINLKNLEEAYSICNPIYLKFIIAKVQYVYVCITATQLSLSHSIAM